MLASWMGGDGVARGVAILNTAGIPTFSYPDTAARAFTYMWRYSDNLRGLYETPAIGGRASELDHQLVARMSKVSFSNRAQPGTGVAQRVRIQTDPVALWHSCGRDADRAQ